MAASSPFTDLVAECWAKPLASYGFKAGVSSPYTIAFVSDKAVLIVGQGREAVSASLAPQATATKDDPDYVQLVALFAHLKLIDAKKKLLSKANDPVQLKRDLIRCAELFPKIKDYLMGTIADYDPIWGPDEDTEE